MTRQAPGLSQQQSLYVRAFEQKLRTPEGIDICMDIARAIGAKLERMKRRRPITRKARV